LVTFAASLATRVASDAANVTTDPGPLADTSAIMIHRAIFCLALVLAANAAQAQVLLKNICHVKGQEGSSLHGLGLVVGLNGTGDGGDFLPAMRCVAQAMELMGNPVGKGGAAELKNAKNVALVMVTATIPGAGAREGDRIDCVVSSIGSAKNLDGGRLFLTPLQGPQPRNPRVFALAEGPIKIDGPDNPRTGRIFEGCRLEEDFNHPFVRDNKITLVLKPSHADWQVAQDIAEMINDNTQLQVASRYDVLATAPNQVNIEVTIPPQYREVPGQWVAQIMSLPIVEPQTEARVYVNERAGNVVVSGDVEIGTVLVTHKNLVVEAGKTPPFVPVEMNPTRTATLKSLVDALNAVKVPTADIIEILKGVEKTGNLHGRLIIE
jgi:flagellar P-ring protein precursor FlgI